MNDLILKVCKITYENGITQIKNLISHDTYINFFNIISLFIFHNVYFIYLYIIRKKPIYKIKIMI